MREGGPSLPRRSLVGADVAELAKKYARPRDVRVVFTNGVFDLLHRGHVELLQHASEMGDVLIVGVNSDASTRALKKGTDRPIRTENERAFLLSALACVDHVCLFEEDTPERLIAVLRPDVLVKGGDYRPEDVVGREVVEADDGHVVIVPLVPGYSATELIARIQETGR